MKRHDRLFGCLLVCSCLRWDLTLNTDSSRFLRVALSARVHCPCLFRVRANHVCELQQKWLDYIQIFFIVRYIVSLF